MCSETDRISSLLKTRIMFDCDNPEEILVENEVEGKKDITIESGNSSELRSENPEAATEKLTETEISVQENENLDHRREELQEINEKNEAQNEGTVSSRQSVNPDITEEEEEENDGFRTPTSSHHKIPVPTECPPAPKKAWPPPRKYLKRKGSSSPSASRSLQFDQSSEVESFFRPKADEENAEELKIKKSRRDDEE